MAENHCDCCLKTFAYTGIGLLLYYFVRKYIQGAQYKKPTRCDGKIVLITGANTGLGKAAALELAKRGGTIYIGCRSVERGNTACEEIKQESGNNNVFVRELDLASFESVRNFVKKFVTEVDKLDILINNAAVCFCPKMYTKDGLELHMGVNHFGHFLLTNLLMDTIKKSPAARIVNVSSWSHMGGVIDKENINSEKSYSRIAGYSNSKLANMMFTKELAKRFKDTNIRSYAVHPGSVQTEAVRFITFFSILKPLHYLFTKTPHSGCQTYIYCALDPDLSKESGKYYAECRETKHNKLVEDDALTSWLWDHSEKVTGLSNKAN